MTDALSEIRRPISYMSEHSNITAWNAKIKNNIDWGGSQKDRKSWHTTQGWQGVKGGEHKKCSKTIVNSTKVSGYAKNSPLALAKTRP